MRIPKVLIFTITYEGKDYVWDEFISHAKAISFPQKHSIIDNSKDGGVYFNTLKDRLKDTDIEVYNTARGNNSREALARSQNFARKYAIDNGYDYMLSLESDIIVPHSVLFDLLKHARPVVGVVYEIGTKEMNPRPLCITMPYKTKIGLVGTRLVQPDEFKLFRNNGLQKVVNCGLGCTLIRRDIFEKYVFYYHPDLKGHSDTFFANCLWNDNIPFMVDTDIFVEHKNVPWINVKDR